MRNSRQESVLRSRFSRLLVVGVATVAGFTIAPRELTAADAIWIGGTTDFSNSGGWNGALLPSDPTASRWFFEQYRTQRSDPPPAAISLTGTVTTTGSGEIDAGRILNIDGGTLNVGGVTGTATLNSNAYMNGTGGASPMYTGALAYSSGWDITSNINIYNGGTIRALNVIPNASQSFTGDMRVKFSGHANAEISGNLGAGMDTTNGNTSGRVIVEGYHASSAINVGSLLVYAGGYNPNDGYNYPLNRGADGGKIVASLTAANDSGLSNTINVSADGAFTIDTREFFYPALTTTVPKAQQMRPAQFLVELNGYDAAAGIGDVFQLVKLLGTGDTTSGDFGNVSWDSEFLMAGHKWKIQKQYDMNGDTVIGTGETGLFLQNTAVPEPSTWALMGFAGAMAVLAGRRRQARP